MSTWFDCNKQKQLQNQDLPKFDFLYFFIELGDIPNGEEDSFDKILESYCKYKLLVIYS